jgi:hypothetical protein
MPVEVERTVSYCLNPDDPSEYYEYEKYTIMVPNDCYLKMESNIKNAEDFIIRVDNLISKLKNGYAPEKTSRFKRRKIVATQKSNYENLL